MDYTRRDFLNTIVSATLGAAGLAVPSTLRTDKEGRGAEDFKVIPDRGTVLFQGDSITDWGRNKEDQAPNSGLGHGYAMLASAHLLDKLASRNIKCYNRGISGNKVFQLANRWEEDCLQLKPDLLSILIGVNDLWHTIDGNYDGTVEIYETDFRALLQRTKEKMPDVKLVIGEPYVLKEGSAITDEWFPVFFEYQKVARKLADEFEAAFIPYQSVYDEASKRAEPTYWSEDGVHPTTAGAHLMASAWLETVKRM